MPRLTVEPQVQPLTFPSHQPPPPPPPPPEAVLPACATVAVGPRAPGLWMCRCGRGVITVRSLAPEVLHEPIIGVDPRSTASASCLPAGIPLAVERDRLLSHSLPTSRCVGRLGCQISLSRALRLPGKRINGVRLFIYVRADRGVVCV